MEAKKKIVDNTDPFQQPGFSQDLEKKLFSFLDSISAAKFSLTTKKRSSKLPSLGVGYFLLKLLCFLCILGRHRRGHLSVFIVIIVIILIFLTLLIQNIVERLI